MRFFEIHVFNKRKKVLNIYRQFADNEVDALSKIINSINFDKGKYIKIREIL